MKLIVHIFPFCEQFIENLPVGSRSIMEKYNGTGMDTAQQLLKGFVF